LPSIEKVVAVIETNQTKDAEIIAYFTGQKSDIAVLRQAISEQLPSYMIPQHFIGLETFPLTSNGKINRKALSKALGQPLGQPVAVDAPPQSEIEKGIHQIWKELLDLENIGIHDNFFDVGGHSLLMVRLQSQLKAKFSTDLSLVELFRYPTIHAIARQIQGNSAAAPSPGLDRNQQLRAGKQRLQQRRRQRQSQTAPPQTAPQIHSTTHPETLKTPPEVTPHG